MSNAFLFLFFFHSVHLILWFLVRGHQNINAID